MNVNDNLIFIKEDIKQYKKAAFNPDISVNMKVVEVYILILLYCLTSCIC